jgi:hypothetical protein
VRCTEVNKTRNRCTSVGCALYGSTKKHKTFDMLNYVQDMLLEGQQDMRAAPGSATPSVSTLKKVSGYRV